MIIITHPDAEENLTEYIQFIIIIGLNKKLFMPVIIKVDGRICIEISIPSFKIMHLIYIVNLYICYIFNRQKRNCN